MYTHVHTQTHLKNESHSVSSEVAGWGGPTELSADWQECVLNAEWILGGPLGIWNFVGQENAVGRLNKRSHAHSQLPSLSPSQLMGAGVPPHMSSCSLTGNTAALGAERIPTCKCGDLRSVIFLYFLPTELNMSLRQNLAVWRKLNHNHFGDHLLSFWGTKVLEVEESSGETFPSSFWGPHC